MKYECGVLRAKTEILENMSHSSLFTTNSTWTGQVLSPCLLLETCVIRLNSGSSLTIRCLYLYISSLAAYAYKSLQHIPLFVIPGFRRQADEICALPSYCGL